MKNTKDIRFAGQPLAATDGGVENSYIRVPKKLEGDCCNGNLKNACEDTVVVPLSTATKKITEIVFDGETYTHETGFGRDDKMGLYLWLDEIISNKEIDARVHVMLNDAGDEITIKHYGVLRLESAKEGSNVKASATLCDINTKCEYIYSIVGDVTNGDKISIVSGGDDVELAGTFAYNKDGDAAAATANDATADDLKTKIEAEWGAGTVVSVTPDEDCYCFRVDAINNADAGNYADNGTQVGECETVFE